MRKITWFLVLVGTVFLLWFSGQKAANISMTHDEAGSFLFFFNENILKCVADASCWDSANNHWLNTFLFQKTGWLFGISEFSLRLPNWLAHGLFILSSLLLFRKLKFSNTQLLLGFVLINFQPFVLDFFSQARGYGLLNGFLMASITSLVYYFEDKKQKYFLVSTTLACLGVLSCFTGLNFLMSLLFFCGLVGVGYFLQQKNQFNHFSKDFLIALIPVAITAGIVFYPLTILMNQGEFLWGCDTLIETFTVILKDSIYLNVYIVEEELPRMLAYLSGFLVISVIAVFYNFFKNKKSTSAIILPAGLFFGSLLILLTQNWLLDSKFFINRKSLTLIVTGTLVLIFGIRSLSQRIPVVINLGSWVLMLFVLFHFNRTISLTETREWWYDRYTKEMVQYVAQKTEDGKQISLGTHWFFHPTTTFYQTVYEYDSIEIVPYNKGIVTNEQFDYYYILRENLPILEKNYEIEKEFSYAFLLMRKKIK